MERSEGRRGVSPGMIVGIVLVIILGWFALANSGRVNVDFVFFDTEMRLIFVILGSAVLGALIASVIAWRHK
jgi:uncharacterized integral membrane protein